MKFMAALGFALYEAYQVLEFVVKIIAVIAFPVLLYFGVKSFFEMKNDIEFMSKARKYGAA